MRLQFHHGVKDANEVLKRVRPLLRDLKLPVSGVSFYIESYVNCREQGYAIMGFTYGDNMGPDREFYCALSQYRNSDSVVLYIASNENHFNKFQSHQMWTGNIPETEVWRDSVHVSPTEVKGEHYQKAAEIIAEEIKLFVSPKYRTSKHFYTDLAVVEQMARIENDRKENEKFQAKVAQDRKKRKAKKKLLKQSQAA
jgi:hypothetical protein